MIDCSQAAGRPILVAASDVFDAGLARAAIEELGRVPVLVQNVGDAMRHLGGSGRGYGAMMVGERVGEVSGFTLCAVARDAGYRLPMILVTSDVCRWTAVRAARLQVNVLWHPVPARRIAQALHGMLPRTPCGSPGNVKLPTWPQASSTSAPAAGGGGKPHPQTDRWRPTRSLW